MMRKSTLWPSPSWFWPLPGLMAQRPRRQHLRHVTDSRAPRCPAPRSRSRATPAPAPRPGRPGRLPLPGRPPRDAQATVASPDSRPWSAASSWPSAQQRRLSVRLKVARSRRRSRSPPRRRWWTPRRSGTATTITKDELARIPTARDPWGILQTVAGVLVDRVNLAGNESGAAGPLRRQGRRPQEQHVGDRRRSSITDMSAFGTSSTYYTTTPSTRSASRPAATTSRSPPAASASASSPSAAPTVARQRRGLPDPRRLAVRRTCPTSSERPAACRAATRPTTPSRSPTTASTSAGRS